MKEFYVKVPEDKELFFSELLNNLGYSYEKLFEQDIHQNIVPDNDDEEYFTDSDD